MAISGAQFKSALKNLGAGDSLAGGATFDQLATNANACAKAAGIKTRKGMAAFLGNLAQECNYFRTTTEYGSGQSYAPYIGRTFIQITGQSNYSALGNWLKARGKISSGSAFVNNPASLSSYNYAWDGPLWYFSVSRSWPGYPTLAAVADNGSLLMVARAINAGSPFWDGTPNGMTARQAAYDAFYALGDSIAPGSTSTTTTAPAGYINGTGAQVAATAVAAEQKWGPHGPWNQYPPFMKELPRGAEAWCADFAAWCVLKVSGYHMKSLTSLYPSTSAWMAAAIKSPLWQEVSYANSRAGDINFYARTAANARAGKMYHTEIVEAGPTSAGHDQKTVGGNTSRPGFKQSMSDGDCFARKTRSDLDTAYYVIRTFRPPYWSNNTNTTPPPPDDPVVVEDPAPELPPATTVDRFGFLLDQNPIDELRVSSSFWETATSSARTETVVDAWYGGREVWPNLPLLASQSVVHVTADPVRRNADLTFEPNSQAEARELFDLLQTPGMQLRVRTGWSWGGATELVPVFTGHCYAPVANWPGRQIKINVPDLAYEVARDWFTNPVMTSPELTYAENIGFFSTEAAQTSLMADLSGNTDLMPQIIVDAQPGCRIDAITEMSQAIGCEWYASPVPNRFVLRPLADLRQQPKWTISEGVNLLGLTHTADLTQVGNNWMVQSERADSSTVSGTYKAPDGPLAFGGPFNRKTRRFVTSLLETREQCEDLAETLFTRYAGTVHNISWDQLPNPLMERGDRIRVEQGQNRFDAILETFDIPLGSQRSAPGTIRLLSDVQGVE